MNKKKFELQFDVSMELSDIRRQLNSLSESMNKFELPADATKKLDGALKKTLERLADFETRSERGMENLADSKELEKAWASVTKALDEISTVLKTMDVSKLFPKEVKANIEGAKAALNSYVTQLEKIKGSDAYKAKLDEHGKAIADQKAREAQVAKGEKALVGAQATYEGRKAAWDKVREQYNQEAAQVEALNRLYLEQDKILKDLELKKAKLKAAGYVNDKGELSANARKMEAAGTANKTKLRQAKDLYGELQTASAKKEDTKSKLSSAKAGLKPLQTIKEQYESAEGALQQAKAEVESLATALQQAQERAAALAQEMQNLLQSESATSWQETVAIFKELTGIDLEETAGDVNAIKAAIEKYKQDELAKVPGVMDKIQKEAKETQGPVVKVGEALEEAGETAEDLERASNEMDNLKRQILDFFSVGSAINIFKRALSDAFQTVKELDAVMTEAAVVTDFSIGDMWEQMPQYSKNASELGVATRDLYAATTLYYQQGLKGNEVMKVGTETMKMAKIASMDATEATQAMTAALRGFNMQVDEMNAQKVSDVYSKLAAVTAADTSQIATAMSKTASIAASANMEFETTAAFLAQIIETTQEAPETAGTALKTIIARFSEVKNLQSQGLTSGMDTEGEAIDLNKISTALRSVGISMDAFFAGQEGLDDVLLRLSEKWDTLDFTTQRYIATAAAGSRQQSRFIAMMSNYGRTMELVNEANNSAGASQEQYQKTLEGLDAKLAQLKNAWDQFTMGLANNEVLKTGVDFLTWILETVNKLTDAISGGNGLAKSVVSLLAVIGALKGGASILGKTSIGKGASKALSSVTGSEKNNNKKKIREEYQLGYSHGSGYKQGYTDATQGLENNATQAIEELDNLGEKGANSAKAMTTEFNKAGVAMVGVGSALSLLAGHLDSIGEDGAAENVRVLGAAFTTVGAIVPAVAQVLKQAGIEVSMAWWWVTLIAAAIAAIVAGLVMFANAVKKASAGFKLEKAIEATERAEEAAREAEAAYEDLLSAKDGYNELQKQLEGLTEGTIEWKRALIDSKQQVLDLIKQYPKLAQYVKQGKYGLEIDDSGWEYLDQEAIRRLQAAQANQVGASMSQATADFNVFLEDMALAGLSGYMAQDMEGLVEEYLSNGLDVSAMVEELNTTRDALVSERSKYSAGNTDVPQTSAHYKAADQEYISLSNDIGELDAQISYLNNNFEDWVDEYALRMETYTEQLKAYTQQLAIYVSDKNQGLDYFTKVSVAIADNKASMFETKKQSYADALREQYKFNESGLKREYEDEFGVKPDEQLTTEDMINAIAFNRISKEFSAILDKVLNTISSYKESDAIATALSGNASGVTVSELAYASEIDLFEMAGILGYGPERRGQMLADLGMTEDEYDSQQAALQERYKRAISGFGGTYNANKDFIKGLKIESAEQLLRQFELGRLTTDAQKQGLITALQNVLTAEGLTPEGRIKLENTLATTNWEDPFQGLDAMDAMLAEGVSVEIIKEYWDAATAGVQSYVDTETEALQLAGRMQNKVKKLSELSSRMTEGTLTVDDMAMLEKAGVDTNNYKLTAEGWRASAQETETAMETMRAYYLMQAEKQKEEIELEKNSVGITKERKEELDETLAIVEKTIEMLQQPITTTYNVETHIDLFDRIKEAIVFDRQQEIDKLTEINDTIADSNSRIVSAMRESVEDSRRARENERTEQEIADKQARLAYLKMDTSGANAMAIKQLEEEIAQDQESYTDRLIDEKISALEEQNNIAQEQRAQQIELMQLQLEQDEKTGALWTYVEKLFEDGYDATTGKLREDSEAYKLLYQAESVASMSAIAQEEWRKELLEAFKGIHIHIYQPEKEADEVEVVTSNYAGPSGGAGGRYAVVNSIKYATGGLADFTGPAWLDGTKTNPEYVLSAAQTERFFELVDILGDLRFGTSNSTQNNRENNFDIDINVESINSDYDVEQVAIKVKDFIVNSSRYRNNNTL